MTALAAKVLFCVQSMGAVRWLSGLMPDDQTKRLLARATFVYLDAFLKLAPRLKNQLKGTGADVTSQHGLLRSLDEEYEANYARIRDKLAAHRQVMGLGELIEAWNEVDLVSTSILTDDARYIYDLLAGGRPDVPAYRDLSGVNDPALADRIRAGVSGTQPGVRFAADDLAITRPQTVTLIPTGDLQWKVMQVLGIIDGLKHSNLLHGLLAGAVELQRIARSLLVLDTINLTDNVLAEDTGNSAPADSLLAVAKREAAGASKVLEQAAASRDRAAEGRIRELRNKIAAHVDAQDDLGDLLTRLDGLARADVSALVSHVLPAFDTFCQRAGVADLVLLHGRALKGFDAVPARFTKPF